MNLIRQTSPESNLQDILKDIAKEWALLTDEDKKPFYELALKGNKKMGLLKISISPDKSRYFEEKRIYSDLIPSRLKTKKTKVSGFLCFCNEMRPIVKKENPQANCVTIIKELSSR